MSQTTTTTASTDSQTGTPPASTQPANGTAPAGANANGTAPANGAVNGAGSSSAGTENTEIMIPKTRFDEINAAKKAAEDKLAQIEAEKQKAEQERLKAQGQWQEIADKATADLEALKPKAEKADQYEAAIKARVDARMKDVPEHIKKLLEGLDPLGAWMWLEENADKLNPTPAPGTNAGERGERGNRTVDPKTVLKRQSY